MSNTSQILKGGILFGIIATASILAILSVSISLLPTIKFFVPVTNENISLMNISLTVVFVFVTSIYVYHTSEILVQMRSEQKISFIQTQLKSFYYPLLDELQNILFEIDDAFITVDTFNNSSKLDVDIKNKIYNDLIYSPDQYESTKNNLRGLLKYRYLAIDSIKTKFYDFLNEMIEHVNEYQNDIQEEQYIMDLRDSLIKDIYKEIEKLENRMNDFMK